MMKLTPLPTKEAQKLWAMVAENELPIEKLMKRDGTFLPVTDELKMKYLAPAEAAKKTTIREDIILKDPKHIPAHLRGAQPAKIPEALRDRDDDYDNPPSGFIKKLDWFRRNYKPSYMIKRSKNWMAQTSGSQTVANSLLDSKKAIAKRKAEEYELRRRQRLNKN
jgi:YidC/Oxa1 family membrane protein insertase